MERIVAIEGAHVQMTGFQQKERRRPVERAMTCVTRAYDVTEEFRHVMLFRDFHMGVHHLTNARLLFCTLVGRVLVHFDVDDHVGPHHLHFWLDAPALHEDLNGGIIFRAGQHLAHLDFEKHVAPLALAVACRDDVLKYYVPAELVASPPPLEKYAPPPPPAHDPDVPF